MSWNNTGNENKSDNKDGFNKRLIHMVICYGLPIIIIFTLSFIARLSLSVARALGKIAPFLCSLIMIGMMPMMGGNKKKSCCSNEDEK